MNFTAGDNKRLRMSADDRLDAPRFEGTETHVFVPAAETAEPVSSTEDPTKMPEGPGGGSEQMIGGCTAAAGPCLTLLVALALRRRAGSGRPSRSASR